jgi:hypothetical protein
MIPVLLSQIALLILIAPVLIAFAVGLHRLRGRLTPFEACVGATSLLALGIPALMLALSCIPLHRPLDHLRPVQACISLASLAWLILRRAESGTFLRTLFASLRDGLLHASWTIKCAAAVGAATHLCSTLLGAWDAPSMFDEIQYHMPAALQAWQDGRVGPVTHWRTDNFADSYPRGAQLIQGWAFAISHSDAALHTVNGFFGAILGACAAIGARRLGCSRQWAIAAAALVLPVQGVMLMSRLGYIDLTVAGVLALATVFAIPESQTESQTQGNSTTRAGLGSLLVFLSACVAATWMKFHAAPICAALGAVRLISIFHTERWAALRDLAWYALALTLAWIPLARTWVVYGTPIYPLELRVGTTVIFDGPLRVSDMLFWDRDLTRLQKYVSYWSPNVNVWGPDEKGLLGPWFAIIGFSSLIVMLLGNLRTPRAGHWIVLTPFALSILMEGGHHCRYVLILLVSASVATCWLFSQIAAIQSAARGFVLLCVLACAAIDATSTLPYLRGMRDMAQEPLMDFNRNRDLLTRTLSWKNSRHYPTGTDYLAIRQHVQPGERLVYAVSCSPGMLYDDHYSFAIEARPMVQIQTKPLDRNEYVFTFAETPVSALALRAQRENRDPLLRLDPSRRPLLLPTDSAAVTSLLPPLEGVADPALAAQWIAGLHRDHIDAVLVWSDSHEREAIKRVPSMFTEVWTRQELPDLRSLTLYRRAPNPS